jgi:hypothetical protein
MPPTLTVLRTCLFCDKPLPANGGLRGCCSARCAYLENDANDDYEPSED